MKIKGNSSLLQIFLKISIQTIIRKISHFCTVMMQYFTIEIDKAFILTSYFS